MLRQMIQIDEKKCNGCGLCAAACHEGAIGMVDGKARLLRDDYCDGLGDCLPVCPTGAISFVQREAAAYDEAAVLARKAAALRNSAPIQTPPGGGCPGSRSRVLMHEDVCASGPYSSSWPRSALPISTGLTCSSPQTAPLLLTVTFTRNSCAAKSP